MRGVGSVVAPNKVEVQGEKGVETINTKNILIASGSEVTPFPGVTVRVYVFGIIILLINIISIISHRILSIIKNNKLFKPEVSREY